MPMPRYTISKKKMMLFYHNRLQREYIRIEGKEVVFEDGFLSKQRLFVHRAVKGSVRGRFALTELTTGLFINSGSTYKMAIEGSVLRIEGAGGEVVFLNALEKALQVSGPAPEPRVAS